MSILADKKEDSLDPFNLILPSCAISLLLYVVWELFHSSAFQIAKSVFGGLLIIYYSWEIIYFDSIMPGIEPVSPLSPSPIKKMARSTLHLNYSMAIVIGIFVALFINWYT